MKDLILDLTDNGGGLMQAAIEMADEFLTDRKMIVYSQGISSPKQVNYATTRGTFEKGKLVVLVDEGSASASEIVTGAIQDWDRGLVIGRRTFGKGLVQKPFNLSDGSQIRLTIARYYTPVGRNIQKSYKDGDEAYHKDLMDRMKHGEFYSADSIHFPDSLKYFTPNHRTVYGGGGIMPDIFVPLDTTGNSEYLTNLFRKGVLSQFSLKYLDQERARLETTYPTAADFVKNFKTDQTFMDRFNAYAAKDSVSFDAKGYAISKQILQTQLKARLAQNMFGNDAMFEVINAINASFNKAVESIGNDSFEKKKISVK
jgi:carboxyl-terminal processing protease